VGPGSGVSGERTRRLTPHDFIPPFLKRRAALYVDGFNLHHSILELRRPELLWLDLPRLGKAIIAPGERLATTVWVSAHRPQRRNRMQALFAYEQALRARGVRCLMGHFVVHTDRCFECGHTWADSVEKQSDVNLALAVAADAAADRFDVAYVVTTDGDHAATARYLKESHPDKRLVGVAPPGRRHNRQIVEWCDRLVEIDEAQVAQAVLPERLRRGQAWIERPDAWAPPLAHEAFDDAPPPGPPPPMPRRGHLRLVVSNPQP
jgi:hypothetical protein